MREGGTNLELLDEDFGEHLLERDVVLLRPGDGDPGVDVVDLGSDGREAMRDRSRQLRRPERESKKVVREE
jgi:hypothetical protein